MFDADRRYYQPLLWVPTSIHAIFIRGSENNFMNLTPTPIFQYLGPTMMLLFVGSHLTTDSDQLLAEQTGTDVLHPEETEARLLQLQGVGLLVGC